MSERYYGNVRFPAWAIKYLPEVKSTSNLSNRLSKWGDDPKVLCFEDEQAVDGIPWLVDELVKLDIPHDASCGAYCEIPAMNRWFRFQPNGETVVSEAEEDPDHIAISVLLRWIEKGYSLATIKQHLQKVLDDAKPLGPPLAEIPEEQWLEHCRLVVKMGKKLDIESMAAAVQS